MTAFALAIVLYAVQHYGRQTGGRQDATAATLTAQMACHNRNRVVTL